MAVKPIYIAAGFVLVVIALASLMEFSPNSLPILKGAVITVSTPPVAPTSGTGTSVFTTSPTGPSSSTTTVPQANAAPFSTLIGSVLNGGVLPGNLIATKQLQGAGQYTYPEILSLVNAYPAMSPYTGAGGVPFSLVAASANGGGVIFNQGFSKTSPNNDNLLRMQCTQLATLLCNYGSNGESETLWFAGFPVFDQATGVNNFRLLSATGAYQIVFGTPIQTNGTAVATGNAGLQLLGSSYTISGVAAPSSRVGESNVITGGSITLSSQSGNTTLLTNGQVYSTANPGWRVNLYWANTTTMSSGRALALASIVIYNTTPTSLAPGQSFSFLQSSHKLTFIGLNNSQGSIPVTVTLAPTQVIAYQNEGKSLSTVIASQLTEPVAELTITASANVFSFSGQSQLSSVTFGLNPYELNEKAQVTSPGNTMVQLLYNAPGAASRISGTNPLTVSVTGYPSVTAMAPVTQSVTFVADSGNVALVTPLVNVTAVQLSRAIPGSLSVAVYSSKSTSASSYTQLANLTSMKGGVLLYQEVSSPPIYGFVTPPTVLYTEPGYASSAFSLSGSAYGNASILGTQQYYYLTMNDLNPQLGSQYVSPSFSIGIVNSTLGASATPIFMLNYSADIGGTAPGTPFNVTYMPELATGHSITVGPGFFSALGSQFATVSSTTDSFNMVKGTGARLSFQVT